MNRLPRALRLTAAAAVLYTAAATATVSATAAINAHLSAASCRTEAAAALLSGAHCSRRN